MHNGLTRVRDQARQRRDGKIEKESKSLGNVIDARELITRYGADLVRYLLLSTHYRSPIDFGEEVIGARRRRGCRSSFGSSSAIERLTGQPLPEKGDDMDRAAAALLETPHAAFARAVLALKMKFLEMMDDDFNTAGAIAVLHEMAGEVNAFIERNDLSKRPGCAELVTAAAAGAQTRKEPGRGPGPVQSEAGRRRYQGRRSAPDS